jgi:hypothetical protein
MEEEPRTRETRHKVSPFSAVIACNQLLPQPALYGGVIDLCLNLGNVSQVPVLTEDE